MSPEAVALSSSPGGGGVLGLLLGERDRRAAALDQRRVEGRPRLLRLRAAPAGRHDQRGRSPAPVPDPSSLLLPHEVGAHRATRFATLQASCLRSFAHGGRAAHDPRRVPPPRARGRGVGRGLHGAGRGAADRARSVEPGEIRAKLPAAAPEEPEPFEALMRDLDEIVLPGITHWQSPGWFGVLPGQRVAAVDPGRARVRRPRRAGDAVVVEPGADGDRGARARLAGRPARPAGALQDGAGPRRRRDPDERVGLHPSRARDRARAAAGAATDELVAYGSSQAHSSVERGAKIAGFRHIRKVEVDEAFALRPDALRRAIEQDRGRRPDPRDRHERDRHDRHRRRRPDRGDRRPRAGARPLAPRRRRVGRLGDALRGAPRPPARRRAGRQLHLQPAQVAVHQLRLQRPLGGRPRAADRDALDRSRPTCATPRRSPAR